MVERSRSHWRLVVEVSGKDTPKESIPPPKRPGPGQIVVVAAFDLFGVRRRVAAFSLRSLRCESGDKSPHSKITSPGHIRRNEMDDSAKAAANPSHFRAARRAAESLRTHIRNMWEQNDKTAAATARLWLCKTSKAKQEWCALELLGSLSQRERELTLPLGLAYLSNQSTKLAEPKFFV